MGETHAFEPGVPVEGYIYDEASGEYYPVEDARPESQHYDGDGEAYDGQGYVDSGDHDRRSYDDGPADDGRDTYDGQGYGGNDYDYAYDGQGYASDGAYDSEEEERLWQEEQQQQQQQGRQVTKGVGVQVQQRQQVMANAF